MKPHEIYTGMEVYVDNLRPAYFAFMTPAQVESYGYAFTSSIRQEGLEGFVLGPHKGWLDDAWDVKHSDGTFGVYLGDELKIIHLIYWYKVQKWYGYR